MDAGSQGREGTESTEIAGPDLSGELRWRNGWIIPSRQLKAILDKIDLASERYWGPFLYRGCVSYLVAPTSSGKTVFLKRLARHLALGDPFLAFTPPKPLTVLYIELESPDLVLKEQFDVIEPVDGLDFVRCSGDALEAVLKRSAKDYDVVILDPLVVGFPVENENDNAEANRQLLLFTALKTQHGTAFILTHNVGVSEEAGARGRGASARKDRIDVEWMYTKIGTGRRLEITKDRAGHLGTALEVAFDGELDFALTKLHLPHTTKTGQMVSRVLDAPWSGPQSRAALMLLLGIQRDSADDKLLTRALTYAVKNSMLYQTNPRAPYTRTKEG